MKRTLVLVVFVLKILFLQAQQVSLVAPSNQLVTEDTVVQFVWNKIPSAQSYQIQISTSPAFTSFISNQSGITDHRYSYTFNQNRNTYYWRVRSFDGVTYNLWSVIRSMDIFSPASLDSVVLWLRADSGLILSGPNITQWKDQSGKGNDATQATSLSRPVLDTTYLKNTNTLTFDGVNDFLNFPTLTLNPSYSLMLLQCSSGDVMLMGNAADNYQIRMGFPGNNLAAYNGTMTSSSFFLSPREHFSFLGMINNSGALKFYQNGIQYGSGNIGGFVLNTIAQSISLGFLSGSISEVYVLTDTLSVADLALLNKYICDKYAPPVCLGPDTTLLYGFCPIVLEAKTYYHSYLWNTGDTTHSISTNLPGIYSVRVTDEFGRVSTDSIFISRPLLSLSNTSICFLDSLLIQPGLSNSYSFLWSTGSTDSLLVVSNPGIYWVEITDSTALHCSVRDTIVVAVDSFPVTAS
ncbi:MAG: hypothetical protein V2A54_15180, partial [Bacteroidota bacterium]